MNQEVLNKKKIIQFIQKLSSCEDIEQLLLLLFSESSRFKSLKNIFLFHWAYDYSLKLAYTQSKSIKLIPVTKPWSKSLRLGINEHQDSKHLAEEIKRPVGKLIRVPLSCSSVLANKDSLPLVLLFEHDLVDSDLDKFVEFLDSRISLLSISLEKNLLENHLKNTSLLWENTFDALRDPVAIIDSNYNVLRSNSKFSETSKAQACHKSFLDSNEICSGCPSAKALEKGLTQKGNIKKGNKIFDVYSFPIKIGSGRATTVINHYVDMTHAHELQGRVIQNEKMSAVGQFAGNIAHELNNPLSGLRSLAQVLLDEVAEGSSIHQDLKEIEQAAQRSQSIINNLLDFSKASSHQNKKNISLSQLVKTTLPLLKTTLHEFNYSFDYSDESEDKINVVPDLVRQVIFNIINNASQATDKGGDISVSTRIDGDQASLEVRDSGHGMDAETLAEIFTPFFTTKKKGEGTGLGLSMSREIIESFGGSIRAESTLGQGTIFTIQLPRAGL